MPTSTLVRRRDAIEIIGAALVGKQAGRVHRRISTELAVPASTVRSWLPRFAARAEQLRAAATAWAHQLDRDLGGLEPRGSPFDDALEALGVAAAAAVRRLGLARSNWHVVAALTGALMLAPTAVGRP